MWPPVSASMQRFGEPFFAAMDVWRKHSNHAITLNRVHLLEVASKFLSGYPNSRTAYHFELAYENPNCTLLPEKVPTAGKTPINGGDIIAFEAAKSLVPDVVFAKGGVFFQIHVLRPIAGVLTLEEPAPQSMIAAIEVLLRLPEDAGKATFMFRQLSVEGEGEGDEEEGSRSKMHAFPAQPLSTMGKTMATLLRDVASVEVTKKVMAQLLRKAGPAPRKSNGSSSSGWTKQHESVGNKVAAYFAVSQETAAGAAVQRQLFFGEVIAFAPPTSSKLCNQLFHIRWEDGDEEDYDEEQLRKGQELCEATLGWTESHPSVGTQVAGYFMQTDAGGEERGRRGAQQQATLSMQLFKGTIAKYSPATNSLDQDQLYHVVWEDGDEEDYDEAQLQRGRELFSVHFETLWQLDHPSVGTQVAAPFPDSSDPPVMRIFTGEVTKFSPPTAPSEQDQLYHVVWEDGDEEDYDQEQLERGRDLWAATRNTVVSTCSSGTSARKPKKRRRSAGSS